MIQTAPTLTQQASQASLSDLESNLRIGDLIFIRIPWSPFRQIAAATNTWTNHVGVVSDLGRAGAIVAESRFPISCRTSCAHFVRRSEKGRAAVLRLPRALSELEIQRLRRAVEGRLGRVYDTGFNLRSRRQFCSRFAHEVLLEATGEELGQVTTFRDLLAANSEVDLRIWRVWYFGRIPWARPTITPASLYLSDALQVVFDGAVQRA